MRFLKVLAILPLLLAARITHRSRFLRQALHALVALGEQELAVGLAVSVLESYPDDSEWLRDHVVPEELWGEVWPLPEPSAA